MTVLPITFDQYPKKRRVASSGFYSSSFKVLKTSQHIDVDVFFDELMQNEKFLKYAQKVEERFTKSKDGFTNLSEKYSK